MHFDDRLATVLRHRAAGERAARTQYRQLLDLLGGIAHESDAGDPSLEAAAYLRLDALADHIPAPVRARIVTEGGARIRNARLVQWFGEAEPDVASAALALASLSAEQWERVIPDLPVRARGFLRLRRDLPERALSVLDRLGVRDRGLPEPAGARRPEAAPPKEVPPPSVPEVAQRSSETESGKSGIGDLVRRIEAFQKARDHGEDPEGSGDSSDRSAPRLPLGEKTAARPDGKPGETRRKSIAHFAFSTDVDGRIEWADAPVAPMVVGTDLVAHDASIDPASASEFAKAFFDRRPVREASLELDGAERIAGGWLLDATPRFTRSGGRFFGYVGRLRRPPENTAQERAAAQADRIRQLLHELRTPVNAIQGFAEVIQQQLFGATPHEYRALAAAIAGDSARMLAGFDELDRLAKLEGGIVEMQAGESDIAAILARQAEQLQTVLSPRVARLAADWGDRAAPIALAQAESERLAWRLLATIASATGAGETIPIGLDIDDGTLTMRSALPNALATASDVFSTDTRPIGGALSPGIFGAGFALRLARAEARTIDGDLYREENDLFLILPLLTAVSDGPSPAAIQGLQTGRDEDRDRDRTTG